MFILNLFTVTNIYHRTTACDQSIYISYFINTIQVSCRSNITVKVAVWFNFVPITKEHVMKMIVDEILHFGRVSQII